MSDNRGRSAVFWICVVALTAVALDHGFTEDVPPSSSPKIDPSYPNPQLAQVSAAAPSRPKLDLEQPLKTISYAVVCDQDVLIRTAASRRAQDDFSKVYDAFQSVFGRSEKVRAAGCEEWKRGIPVYQAGRMRPPFDDLIGFSTSPNGMREYFTMPAELENTQTGGKEE